MNTRIESSKRSRPQKLWRRLGASFFLAISIDGYSHQGDETSYKYLGSCSTKAIGAVSFEVYQDNNDRSNGIAELFRPMYQPLANQIIQVQISEDKETSTFFVSGPDLNRISFRKKLPTTAEINLQSNELGALKYNCVSER